MGRRYPDDIDDMHSEAAVDDLERRAVAVRPARRCRPEQVAFGASSLPARTAITGSWRSSS